MQQLFNHDQQPASGRYFTLLELLVVIGIIALLASLLMPTLTAAKGKAHAAVCASYQKQIGVSFELYLGDYDDYYPAAQDPVSSSPYVWLWMGRGWRQLLAPYITPDISGDNPSILFCPADKISVASYDSTSYGYSMAFYHSPAQINALNSIAHTYSSPQRVLGQNVAALKYPSHKGLAGEWLSNHDKISLDQGWWCWDGARNFLFADGHVEFVRAVSMNRARDGFPDINLTVDGIEGKDID